MGVIAHEMGHVSYQWLQWNEEYKAAVKADPGIPSGYARSRPTSEEISETLPAWFITRFRRD